MKSLAYVIIALSIISAFTWIALYTRDESVLARYSSNFRANTTERIYLWLIEGWANVSLFIPPCHATDFIVYRRMDGSIIYREFFEGPRRELLQVHIPISGHYVFQVASKRVENCTAPDIPGAIIVYQWGQPEFKLRTLTLTITTIMLVPGALILAYSVLRLR